MKLLIVFCLINGIYAVPTVWRIIGGHKAEEGQFPYQISIKLNRNHHCGGAIIGKKWILTAAHCVKNFNVDYLSIMFGTTSLINGGTVYSIQKAIIHEKYDEIYAKNDIALLKLRSEIDFNSNVSLIPLYSQPVPTGSELVVSGWGYTSYNPETENGISPNDLQFLNLEAISYSFCINLWYPVPISDAEICTLNKVGEGVCKGDSGSPLVFKGMLAGIVSWGKPCAVGKPDVFTSVFKHIQWINENMINN